MLFRSHVDGVAASMAAVILAAADRVVINDYAKVMVHSPYYVDDTGERAKHLSAKDRKSLSMLRDTLIQLLKKRGIEEEALNTMMRTDSWFTADEARTALLVDEVVSTQRKKELAAVEPMHLVALLQEEVTNKTRYRMKNIIAKLGLPEESNEQAVEQAVAILQGQNEVLAKMVDKMLEVGRKTGVITEKNEAAMKRLASTDIDLFVDMLDIEKFEKSEDAPRMSEIIAALQRSSGTGSTQEKDWDWYQKNDPQALRELKGQDAAAYNKLYKAYWGEEPK